MSNNNPAISVMIPVYNAESFLQETIDSVLWQTFTDFELLLMDDGSTDNSSEIIRSYDDPRIHYVSCLHNFIETLNRGLDMAKGKYIALLDHDDLMMPYRLQTQFCFMEANPHLVASGGFMHTFGWYAERFEAPLKHKDLILYYSPIYNPTGFIRRDVLLQHQIKYKQGYSFSADFKLWMDIMQAGEIANIPKILTLYRTNKEQTSVKNYTDCVLAAQKIQIEAIDSYLSFLIKNISGFDNMVISKFLSLIQSLKSRHFVSEKTYIQFMREIIVNSI